MTDAGTPPRRTADRHRAAGTPCEPVPPRAAVPPAGARGRAPSAGRVGPPPAAQRRAAACERAAGRTRSGASRGSGRPRAAAAPRSRGPPSGARLSSAPPSARSASGAPARSAGRPRAHAARRPATAALRYGFAAVCTLLLVIGGRLVQLQGVDHTDYAGAAAAQRVDTVTLHALRGEILDRFGTPLAYTSDAQDITADPTQVPAAHARARTPPSSRPLLGRRRPRSLPRSAVQGAVRGAGHGALAGARAEGRRPRRCAGIYTQATTQRQYPGHDHGGERHRHRALRRHRRGRHRVRSTTTCWPAATAARPTRVDNVGNVNPSSRTVTEPARNGATVTADDRPEPAVHRAAAARPGRVASPGARGAHDGRPRRQDRPGAGAGVVRARSTPRNPNTIDPNEPINPPVMSAFEPGSVQKAITFAAALQQKLITPRTVVLGAVLDPHGRRRPSATPGTTRPSSSPRPASWPSRPTSAR